MFKTTCADGLEVNKREEALLMAETESQSQTEQKGGDKKKGVVKKVVAVTAVVAVVGALLYYFWPREERNVVTQNNVNSVIRDMDDAEPVETGYYMVTMNNEWHFPNGEAPSSDAYVENDPENANAVYFDVFLADDETNAIYKSPVLPLGTSLENITLDTPLDAGTYDCICEYHLVDDDQNTLSTLRVTITIIVEG